jgi:hypothetical protein
MPLFFYKAGEKVNLSKSARENIITTLLLAAHIEEQREKGNVKRWFGEQGDERLDEAYRLIIQSFEEGLVTQLSKQQAKRLHEDVMSFELSFSSEIEKRLNLPLQVVYTMAEYAIGNTCVGCTIKKHKACPLHITLQIAGIPEACSEAGVCPYRQ